MADTVTERPRLICQVDRGKYDISNCLPDTRAVIPEELKKALEGSQVEHRLKSIVKFKIYPYAEAQDLSEWDRGVILDTYQPHYMDGEGTCCDCHQGPCNLERGVGRCGLTLEAYQAKLSLRAVCRGCLSQMMASRRMLDYCLKRFGREHRVTMGRDHDVTEATWIGIMCGFYPETLGQIDRGLSYAESQLGKALAAGAQGNGTASDFEQLAFHAGTMLFIAQEVAEYLGISLFGFTTAVDHGLADVAWFPPGFWSGFGLVKDDMPTLGFVGDDFIPAWLAIEELKKQGLTDGVQVVGMGAAGDSIARFYNKVCVVGTMYRVKKALRLGLVDVIVANDSCIPFDYLGEARRTGAKLIWTGASALAGLNDRTADPVDDIVKELVNGAEGAAIRDVDKAAHVAVRVVQQVARQAKPVIGDAELKKEAGRCRAGCDLCTYECPNDLLMGKALRAVADKGLEAVFEVEKSCILCGRCQLVCPEK
ncbi:MAG: hypothetical protein AB1603_07515, partial [Chloroflexota bacterium]